MTNQQPPSQQSAEQLFGDALDLPPEQRRAFLAHACPDSPELRRLVEELLAEEERAGSFLRAPLFHRGDPDPDATVSEHALAMRPPSAVALPPRFQVSQLIAGRFAVVRFVARGGMGEVYEVADRLLGNTHVALKVIRPEIAADARSSHRFEQEVILARKVTHPNLCPIYEIFHCEQPAPPFLFLTMKLLCGETLAARLDRGKPARGEALTICSGIVEGVAAIHAAGIVHRDVKPTNVMLEHTGDRLSVTIMDFGLARLHESEHTLAPSGTVAGTPGYLAPELLHGNRPTAATDLFALGVLLHEVLTGERPGLDRDGISPRPHLSLSRADAPATLLRCVHDLLSQSPEQRVRAFQRLRSTAPSSSPAALLAPPPRRLLTRRAFFLTSGSAACALAGAGIWQRDSIYNLLHPLPSKRFVALLDWPPPADSRIRAMLLSLIDTMANELARAEAFDHNFFVAAQQHTSELKTAAELNEVREALGANLVLAASGNTTPTHLSIALHVLDPTTGRTLRYTSLQAPLEQQPSLPERVVRAAARLLNVNHYEPDDDRTRPATNNPDALQAFQAAEALMKEPNDTGLDQAIEHYKAAVDADRHFALAYARLSLAYLRLFAIRSDPSSLTLARANAETALSLDPKHAMSHVALGSLSQYTGDLPGALRQISAALSIDPTDTHTMVYQAQIYEKMGRLKDAEEAYKRVLRQRPNYWLAYNELGNHYAFQGNYVDALAMFKAAAAAEPKRSLTYNNIAVILSQLGRFDEALTAVNQSIALTPLDGAYQTRADILRILHRYPEALESALMGAKLNPEESTNWLEVGDTLSLLPHRANEAASAYLRARDQAEKALAVDPKDGPTWMLLALYSIKAGKADGALGFVKKAEALGASDVYSQLYKARVFALLGKRDDALATLTAAMRRGLTIYQVIGVHDLDFLRSDLTRQPIPSPEQTHSPHDRRTS